MKRLFGLAFEGLLVLAVFSAPAFANGDIVKVMTRNQYVGADLTPVFLAQTPAAFIAAVTTALAQAATNNFPLRAQRFATEVALTMPDLIGLQEVYDFKLNGMNIGPPFVDHLTETLDALAAKGQRYVVAATVVNSDITIPLDVDGDQVPELVRVVDRDVILARKGVTFIKLAGDFTTGGLCGVPVQVPSFPDTLQSEPSVDGCNYTVVAQVNSPVGPITLKRGFVGVDATVRGKKYRFVNTHLEIRELDPTNPSTAIFQSLQSVELVATLHALTPPDRTLILLGDFNSSPEHASIGPIIPPYQIIAGAGFADVWDNKLDVRSRRSIRQPHLRPEARLAGSREKL